MGKGDTLIQLKQSIPFSQSLLPMRGPQTIIFVTASKDGAYSFTSISLSVFLSVQNLSLKT